MLINAEEINKVLAEAGNAVTNKGKKYFESSRVKVSDFVYKSDTDFVAKIYVEGSYVYEVIVKKENGNLSYNCDCPGSSKKNTPCKHVIAAIFDMYINSDNYLNFTSKTEAINFDKDVIENKTYKEKINDQRENDGIISYYENLEIFANIAKGSVVLIPTLSVSNMNKDIEVTFKIGDKKMYILKDLIKFSEAMQKSQTFKYGKELEFLHTIDAFDDNSKKMARFISKKLNEYNEFSKLSDHFAINKRYKECIILKYGALDDLFEILVNKQVQIDDYDYEKCFGVIDFKDSNPILEFEVKENEQGVELIGSLEDYYIFNGEEYTYILYKNSLHRCNKEYTKKIIPLLVEYKDKKSDILYISNKRCTSFCEYILPYIKEMSNVTIDDRIVEKYKAEKLSTKVYLDINSDSDIEAIIKFCYGDYEFNPFDKEQDVKCNRNIIEEAKVKEVFNFNKFLINYKKKVIYLSGDDNIYNFLNEGINTFLEKFEISITERLKNKKIVNPKKVTMGVRIKNNLLNIDIDNLNFSETELKEIFKRYKEKKKYYRLKDGSYINIDSSGIDTLINISKNLNISEKEMVSGNITVPRYRAVYLESIMKENENLTIKKEDSFNQIINDIKSIDDFEFKIPDNFTNVLRNYQKVGFSWLKTLAKYGFGGILADDMGLGKTIQIIALLQDEKNTDKKTSIVVCPSSLYINWKKEINKFAPELNVLIVSGLSDERQKLIKKVKEYDVLITSYDLLKRDIDKYADVTFKYIVADEAQYIKNNNTKNAKALKRLKGDTRFALTGTPIENSLAELWSIFDYIMPGYLYNYKKFKDEFENYIIKDEDKNEMIRLQKIVAPFILRRIKKEVLKELPDKTESVMYSEMDEDQRGIYESYLKKAKDEMSLEIDKNGFEKSRVKILSLIMRLRQICCHPSLFIDNYNGKSSKLTQCLEILEEAIASGHKILLFSQFTSMFEILTKKLQEKDITYLMLTGHTKVEERSELVEEFNKNKNINVFLISLKAGGTGLNLTGADMVIHYDPWWNLSVQNQATDRAYRIGQRNNVQVFKLISQNSIEEKIEKLQQKKQSLTDSIIKEGETFISKMSKEELLDLFD